MSAVSVAAIDLGASSGRVVVGRVGPDELSVETVARFPNGPVEHAGRPALGPARAVPSTAWPACARRPAGPVASIGVDSWAVDYGLLRGGELLDLPWCYRDERTAAGVASVHARVAPEDSTGGPGCSSCRSTRSTSSRPRQRLPEADRLLLVPDLVTWWLTGETVCERTNASTTGLLDVRTRRLGPRAAGPGRARAGPAGPARRPRHGRGRHGRRRVARRTGRDRRLARHRVGGGGGADDRPATRRTSPAAPGGWSASSSSSRGHRGQPGGELHQRGRCRRAGALPHQRDGHLAALRDPAHAGATDDLAGAARAGRGVRRPGGRSSTCRTRASCRPRRATCPRGSRPGAASTTSAAPEGRVGAGAQHRGQPGRRRSPHAVEQAATLSGRDVRRVHVVGGGAQNALLCRLLADRLGLPGARRARSRPPRIGNVLVQARAHGVAVGQSRSPAGARRPHPPDRPSTSPPEPTPMKRQLPKPHDLRPLLKFKKPELSAKAPAARAGADDRGPAPDRQAAYAEGGLRLHRRRRRRRGLAGPGPRGVRGRASSTRRSCATSRRVDTSREVLGERVALPFGIAPTGFTRMMQTEGEIAGATAAAAAGIPFTLSTMGTTSIEDVAAATPGGRNWFQLYMWKDRDRSMALVDRAARGRLRHPARHRRRPRRRRPAARHPQRHDHPARRCRPAPSPTRSPGPRGGSTSSPPSRSPSPPSTPGRARSASCWTRCSTRR